MPFTYQIDAEAHMVFLEGTGWLTQTERLNTLGALYDDPEFRPEFPTLCDFSKASSVPTLQELRQVIDFIEQRLPGTAPKRLAILTSKPSTFGVARQFGTLAESVPVLVRVFTNRDEALTWLRQEQP